MSVAGTMTVVLSKDVADLVRRKMESGAYDTPSDVIEYSLRSMQDRDASLEQWLRDEVISGHAEYLADPTKGVPIEAVMARLEARAKDTGQ